MTPGDAAELRDDLPVEQRAQLHRRVVVGADDELVDLAEAGRHRRELGLRRGRRQLLLDAAQALEHELAREPEVGPVVEDDGHRREPASRDAAELDHAGHAVERVLDGNGDGASTSTGDSPRCVVSTETCTVETSGMASMGSVAAAKPPARAA